MELRCENGILFGVVEGGVLEVKCRSKRCGASPGIVVLHKFNLQSGQCKTLRFRDARFLQEGGNSGTHDRTLAIRTSSGHGRTFGGRRPDWYEGGTAGSADAFVH